MIHYRHYRQDKRFSNFRAMKLHLYEIGIPVPKGCKAITACTVIDGYSVKKGYAFCSRNDQFSKRSGRELALARTEGDKEVHLDSLEAFTRRIDSKIAQGKTFAILADHQYFYEVPEILEARGFIKDDKHPTNPTFIGVYPNLRDYTIWGFILNPYKSYNVLR